MRVLFIHQNFPGQFKHLAPALVQRGHDCLALTLRVKEAATWNGVRACADSFLSVGNADETARISVSVNTSALSPAPGQSWTLDIAGLTVPPFALTGSATGQRGSYLQAYDCVGVQPIDEPVVDRSFTGTAGFVVFNVVSVDGFGGFSADVSLTGLEVTATDDAAVVCPVPDRVLTGLDFGYMPA